MVQKLPKRKVPVCRIGDVVSLSLPVDYGVPQGPFLAPFVLLFI